MIVVERDATEALRALAPSQNDLVPAATIALS
jgi:hypothetical protein